MDLHHELATKNVGERFQLQVALRSFGVFVALLYLLIIGVPITHVLTGFLQSGTLHGEIAHARGRQLILASVDALRIFSAGELDRARRVREKKLIAIQPELVLDDDRLSTD